MTTTRSFMKTLTLSMLIVIGSMAGAAAATFVVKNANDSGPGSLRQAVLDANAASTADTIVFDASFNVPRTIKLTTEIRISDNFNTIDKLTITGPGANLLTVSGNNATRISYTIQDDTTSISGMTLRGGAGDVGGAIYNGGTLILRNIVFTNNTSTNGGAIFSARNVTKTSGVLNIVGCVFKNNTATGANINGDGGSAVTIRSGDVTITDSIMTGGTTRGGGGGIRIDSGVVSITNSTISNNTSGGAGNSDGGGGIFNFGDLTLTNCSVSGNTAREDTQGGGIRNVHRLTLINSDVTGNTATEGGGGIYAAGPGADEELVTISN